MNNLLQTFLNRAHTDRIGAQLQLQQHLNPHQSLASALRRAQFEAGFCPDAAQQAICNLRLDPSRQIGRLKQCELTQLSRTIHRVWQQNQSPSSLCPAF